MSKIDRAKLCFYSPVQHSQRGFNTEVEALCHVVKLRPNPSLIQQSLVICTDSKQLETEYNNFMWCQKRDSVTGIALSKLGLDINNLKVQYVRREFNTEAHDLAVKGRNSCMYKCYWAH